MPLILPAERYYHDDYNDLLRYFGPAFKLNWCSARDDKSSEDRAEGHYADNEDFDRRTHIYCYQSIGLMVQGIHRPYIAKILEHCGDMGPASLIEIGSGGGQLGLAMHTLGFNVSFADLYGESFKFLTWRLKDRRLERPVYLLDFGDFEIPKHDIAVCFDVMEHLDPDEQKRLVHRCADLGTNVFMNLIHDERAFMDDVHFPLDTENLTDYIYNLYPSMWWADYYPDDKGNFRQRLVIFGDGVSRSRKSE